MRCQYILKGEKMPYFVKKPIPIEARQFTIDAAHSVAAWCKSDLSTYQDGTPRALLILTLEGNMLAKMNDWIICGVRGEFYACDREIFEETYDIVENIN
jgi:hypothetical protein